MLIIITLSWTHTKCPLIVEWTGKCRRVICRLTTGKHAEKCVGRRFQCSVDVMKCTYTKPRRSSLGQTWAACLLLQGYKPVPYNETTGD